MCQDPKCIICRPKSVEEWEQQVENLRDKLVRLADGLHDMADNADALVDEN